MKPGDCAPLIPRGVPQEPTWLCPYLPHLPPHVPAWEWILGDRSHVSPASPDVTAQGSAARAEPRAGEGAGSLQVPEFPPNPALSWT